MTKKWRLLSAGGAIAALLVIVGVEAATPSPSATGTNPAQVFIDKLAAILHISSNQAATDLKQAELATIDQMVKDGKITQAQADAMKQRIESGQAPGFGLGRFGRFPGPRLDMQLLRDLRTAEVNAAAKALKVSTATLQSDLRSGKSITDLEKAAGISDTDLRNALKNAAKGVLDPAVKAGTITQAQEDRLLQAIANARLPFGGHGGFFGGHRGWFGGPGGAPAPGAAPQGYTE